MSAGRSRGARADGLTRFLGVSGVSPDALKPAALRYGLGLPGISGVVIGIYDDAELRQNLMWLVDVKPLSAGELNALESLTRELARESHEVYCRSRKGVRSAGSAGISR